MSREGFEQSILADPHDPAAPLIYADWLEEHDQAELAQHLRLEVSDVISPPFEVGQSYLICTATLYYVGRVAEKGLGWIRLEEASWVHWTGRLSTLLRTQSFTHRDLASRKPRVEPCGAVGLATATIVSWYPWTGGLPKEPV